MQKNCYSYPVEFVEDVFGASETLSATLKSVTGSESPKVLIVADLNVVQRVEGLGAKIGRYVKEHGIVLAGSPVVLACGEKVKTDNLQSVQQVFAAMLEARLGARDVVLAIGGGTLLDVAGYAAAQMCGGIRQVRLPTTPAAMLDAAYAVRAFMDSAQIKDVLSVASVPAAVIIDSTFANTVLDGVWFGGFGEAVRLALMRDAAFLKRLMTVAADYRARKPEALAVLVRDVSAVRAKKGSTDFAEWLAARLEAMSGYKLPHGYAIAIGVVIELTYAVEAGFLKARDRALVLDLLRTGGALDGLTHSQHLVNQAEGVLAGLDSWFRGHPDWVRELPSAPGRVKVEDRPNRDIYTAVLNFDKISAL